VRHGPPLLVKSDVMSLLKSASMSLIKSGVMSLVKSGVISSVCNDIAMSSRVTKCREVISLGMSWIKSG